MSRPALLALAERFSSRASASELLMVLQQSTELLSVHFASGQLQQVFTEGVNSFTVADRAELRQLLLPILYERVEWFCRSPTGSIPGTVALSAFASLLARVWRICWFEIADNIEVEQGSDSDDDDEPWLGPLKGLKHGSSASNAMSGGMNMSSNSSGIFGRNVTGGTNVENDDPLLHVVAKKMILESSSLPPTLVGVVVLLASVEEMGKQLPHLWPAVQRKTAVAFRDRCLLDIFKIGLQTMQRLLVSAPPMAEPEKTQQRNLITNTLELLQRVFMFDFVGTSPDESNDDLGIIHVPASWSSVFENNDTLRTLVDFYNSTQAAPEQSKALELLSSLVSVRSNLFGNSASQIQFLGNFFDFLGKTITSRKGLDDHSNVHILCRLLVRLKCNFTLTQFVSVPTWKDLIELISQFHIEIMNSPDCNPNVLYYVVSWWQRLSSSIPYLPPTAEPNYLASIIPGLVSTFLHSQLKREEDYPGDESCVLTDRQLPLILAALAPLLEVSGRVDIMTLTIDLFNDYGAQFSNYSLQQFRGELPMELGILERQLALLVHLVAMLAIEKGATLSGPHMLASNRFLNDGIEASAMDEAAAAEQMENLEIEMISCVFVLLQLHDQRFTSQGPGGGSYQLEFALASFLRQFSSSYFALDEVEKKKLQKVLEERHGMSTKEDVLEKILSKIAFNLDKWSQDKWPAGQGPNGTDVTKETLQLFLTLVSGTHSSKIVAKSTLVSQLLANHTTLDWGSNERYRREFYRVLGRIAFKDSEISELHKFLLPFEDKLLVLRDELQRSNPEELYSITPMLSQTLCDLRGALMACHTSSGYETFFEWFYPAGYYETICYTAIQRYAGYNWKIVWSVLRFVEELVTNTHKRIQFPGTSADGHRLFRDTAHLLISVAEKIMLIPTTQGGAVASQGFGSNSRNSMTGSTGQDESTKALQDVRYKAISLFLRIFSRLLIGASDFANIGVFAMFGDKVVSDLLMAACNVIFSLDMEEVQGYTKVVEVLYIALENICQHNLADLLGQDPETTSLALGQLLVIIKRGLRSKVVRVLCCCTQSLDKIGMNHYNATRKLRTRPDSNPTVFSDSHIDILGDIMFELLDLVLLDHDMIHWTLCRPLFVLVQLLPDVFNAIQRAIIDSQPPERTIQLEEAFKALFVGVDGSMRPENREKFTTNALELKNTCKTLIDFNILYKEMVRLSGGPGSGPV